MSQNSDLIGYTLQKFFPAECKVDQLCRQWQLFEKKIPKCYALLADVYLKEKSPRKLYLLNKTFKQTKELYQNILALHIYNYDRVKFSNARQVARPLSSIQ